MSPDTTAPFESNADLVAALEAGDESAAVVVEGWRPFFQNSLMKKGATASEAEEIAAGVIADCFGEQKKLVHAYKRKGSYRALLRMVAINRFIDKKRSAADRKTSPLADGYDPPDPDAREGTDSMEIVELLRDSVARAFEECDPVDLFALRLRFVYGVKQRALARPLGISEAGVSRILAKVLEQVKKQVHHELKERDPYLKLEWEDFIELCADSTSIFGEKDHEV